MDHMVIFYCFIFGYIAGSVPSAYLIVRAIGKTDIRQYASGNVGSTNALRILGPKGGALTLLGDILKTVLALSLPAYLGAGRYLFYAAGLGAIIGHNWPVFLKFKGGKGVAVSASVLTLLQPIAGIISIIIFILVVWMTNYVSLSSMLMAMSWPILLFLFNKPMSEVYYAFFFFVMIVIQHRGNIQRLINGTERKTSLKKTEDSPQK